MNDPEISLAVTYLRARFTLARRDEQGLGAVEWAIIVAIAVGIAIAVGFILQRKAEQTARNVKTR